MPRPVPSAPSVIVKLARSSSFRRRFTERELAAIDRLITHLDMDPVWRAVCNSEDPYLRHAFFDACIYIPRQWERLSKVPTKALIKRLASIADKADALATMIERSKPEIDSIRDWPVTVDMLLRNLAREDQIHGAEQGPVAASPAVARSLPRGPVAGGAVDIGTDDLHEENETDPIVDSDDIEVEGPAATSMDTLLREFARMIRGAPALITSVIRPTKPNEATADQTFAVKALTHFFLSHGGEPEPGLVARTVTAMLDLDSPMEADLVSKNTKGLREWLIDPADDYMWPPE